MFAKINKVIKERWKFYLFGYLVGYVLPMIMDGKVNSYYLFPVKLMGIAGALGLGTALYYSSIKTPIFDGVYKAVKFALIIVSVFIVALIIKNIILSITGFDISPYIANPK